MTALMVVVPDRLSALIDKGEVVERYYNPGGLFDEVHIVMTNDDRPDRSAVRPMVGDAELHLHNLPSPRFSRTAGWQRPLLRGWLAAGAGLATEIQPALVRTYNNFLEGELARHIKATHGIPYVVSLHGVWTVDNDLTLTGRVFARFRRKLERASLAAADATIAVYSPIVPYARRFGARDVRLIYNAVAGGRLVPKSDYSLGAPPHLLSVNRQYPQKDPSNIVRALLEIPATCTIVGDGPRHDAVRLLVDELGLEDRVRLVRAMPNAELCRLLPTTDLMVGRCDYWGMPKSIIEGALAGMPMLVNHIPGLDLEEYHGDWIELCDNTPEDYRRAIEGLLADETRRRALGDRARAVAHARFDPEAMEARVAELYDEVMARGAR
jgi:glycosyltransferase involved in cell wall biosynthesis